MVDPSTLLHLVDNQLSVGRGHQLVAPNSIRSETLELLLCAVRRGERTEQEALARHEAMTEVKIRLLGDRVSRRTAWRIAVDRDIESLRDAEYLAVARLQADALVTTDPDLAASAEGIVRIGAVSELLTAAE